MKRVHILSFLLAVIIFSSCEDEIFPTLRDVPQVLVIDAWITNQQSPQVIKITRTQSYFDQTRPVGVNGALVMVEDNLGNTFNFIPGGESGTYVWDPQESGGVFGEIGRTYTLRVSYNDNLYEAESVMGRVPEIDSIGYIFEEGNFALPDSWIGEFWSRDLPGTGDTYWMRGWKNGVPFLRPNEIVTAFDAGFTRGSNVDGLIFIAPIRRGFNAFDQDENNNFLPSYLPGDSLYVEIHSVSEAAFDFLNQVAIQTNRPGGFAELFAQPLANVPSNIRANGRLANDQVLGFFNVAAVSSAGRTLREADYQ
ncbi:MAG: DUF4249 domain-containing protein [Cyclobacteriaceae bacterium]|nr:DUF4249 domain-containing protein [Cyclobacteriaceae bacterium]